MLTLEILNQINISSKLPSHEQEIADVILNVNSEHYSEVLQDASWELFYQLSSMRESLLNWYDIDKNSDILQISDGFGALTGVLARNSQCVTVLERFLERAQCIAKRYENFDNIFIKVGNIEDLAEHKKYDYIIVEKAICTQKEFEKVIQQTYSFLKEDGKLLLVCENRLGMKYWCGVPDSVYKKPYAGIRGIGAEKALTRVDLINSLNSNEYIGGWKIYYPFPDHKLPQAIYTDDYLPGTSVRDRVISYYLPQERNSMVCLENEISDELIANGVFHIFANSFLVECSPSKFESNTIFSTVSTDRGEEHGFATIISKQGTVEKKMLYPAGRESLNLIYQNQKELEAHGVKCVNAELLTDRIKMPCVKEKTLIDYLQNAFFSQKEAVIKNFDTLYEEILKSSEHVDFSHCAMKGALLTEQNAGTILRKAYIDMIPYNSFYIDQEIVFYDQEFVKECYPAKYILFRALRYTYIYIPQANDIIPLQFFKDKYEMNEIWDIFEREEARFVEDNRNYELLSPFYQWARIQKEEIDRNIDRLLGSESVAQTSKLKKQTYDLERFKQDVTLNAVKKVQLDLLKTFIAVCQKNDLSYCMFYGTLLGTVRHKGYIPWDDDVDVLMPRADYDRLLTIAPEVFLAPYFLQTPENDAGCFYGGYSKLRNSNTTGMEERNKGHYCNQGIWMDIFPLDYVIKDEKKKKEQLKKIKFYQRLLLKKTYPEKNILEDLDKEEYYLKLSKRFSRKELYDKLQEVFTSLEAEKTDKVAVLARYYGKSVYKEYHKEDFEFLVNARFEECDVYIPVGYENCLKTEYGTDYAIYPPESARVPHHSAIYDTEKSYVDYK